MILEPLIRKILEPVIIHTEQSEHGAQRYSHEINVCLCYRVSKFSFHVDETGHWSIFAV